MVHTLNAGLLDWAAVVVYLVFSVALGIWAKKYVEDLDGYMAAGRTVGHLWVSQPL